VIFSHVLYQLSYLGVRIGSGDQAKRAGSLAVVSIAVHPLGIDGRAGNAIAFAEPVQEVAILAPAAAERRMLLHFGRTANRTCLGIRRVRHIRPTWERPRRRAS
jgi:hypothetical protein